MQRWACGVGILAALTGVGCGPTCSTDGVRTGSFPVGASSDCSVGVTETERGTIALQGGGIVAGVPTRVGTLAYTSPMALEPDQLCQRGRGTLELPNADGSTTRYNTLYNDTGTGPSVTLQDVSTGSDVCTVFFRMDNP